MKTGDFIILVCAAALVGILFSRLWQPQAPGASVRIYRGQRTFAELPLDLKRTIDVSGPLGMSVIEIAHGRVRFRSSPCSTKFCVHTGWLRQAGETAVCLPNEVSILVTGVSRYDSINF